MRLEAKKARSTGLIYEYMNIYRLTMNNSTRRPRSASMPSAQTQPMLDARYSLKGKTLAGYCNNYRPSLPFLVLRHVRGGQSSAVHERLYTIVLNIATFSLRSEGDPDFLDRSALPRLVVHVAERPERSGTGFA